MLMIDPPATAGGTDLLQMQLLTFEAKPLPTQAVRLHSSNTNNAVCPPPEVTFNSEDADKRINAPSASF